MLLVLQGASDPEKVFDRTANLEGTQIINYRVDPQEKWCVLVGIAPGAPERYVAQRLHQPASCVLHVASCVETSCVLQTCPCQGFHAAVFSRAEAQSSP